MPPKRNSPLRPLRGGEARPSQRSRRTSASAPPPTMTWGKAAPVLVVCLVFDAIGFFFELFWFFGPALAGVYCTVKVSSWVGSLWGTTATVCAAGATALGYFGAGPLGAFGVIMATAVGLFGWLTIGAWLMITNSRIFKENALWFASSLGVTEIPLIGMLPALTAMTWKMYRRQINTEKAALKKYDQEQAAAQAEERQRRIAEFMAMRAENEARVAEQEQQEEEELSVQQEITREREARAEEHEDALKEIPENTRGRRNLLA